MAEESISTQSRAGKASSETQRLRALAQSHLDEITAEVSVETTQKEIAARDLEKYTKVRRKDRVQSPASPPPEVKGPKLRSAQDVLDRLRHDSTFNITEYHVGYLERFDGILEMPVTSWISESTDEYWIPQHRIKYIKRKNETGTDIVWDREARVDKVFGSGATIDVDDSVASECGGVALE